MKAKTVKLKCSGDRIWPRKCDWEGTPKEAIKIRDTDFGWFQYSWLCPICKTNLASINQNTPLEHPLQEYAK